MTNPASHPVANTINDAAKRLGIGRTTVYELIGAHQLRTFKVGTRTLIPESELTRFVQERIGGVGMTTDAEIIADMAKADEIKSATPGSAVSADAVFLALRMRTKAKPRGYHRSDRDAPPPGVVHGRRRGT